MLVYCNPPMSYSFYAGLMVCLIFGYTFIRSFFIHATIAGWTVLFCYVFLSVMINTPFDILCVNFSYIFIVNLLGMIICYAIETSARREFFLREMLQVEKANVINTNVQLEKQVDNRTKELLIKTEKLKNEIKERKVIEKEREKNSSPSFFNPKKWNQSAP